MHIYVCIAVYAVYLPPPPHHPSPSTHPPPPPLLSLSQTDRETDTEWERERERERGGGGGEREREKEREREIMQIYTYSSMRKSTQDKIDLLKCPLQVKIVHTEIVTVLYCTIQSFTLRYWMSDFGNWTESCQLSLASEIYKRYTIPTQGLQPFLPFCV